MPTEIVDVNLRSETGAVPTRTYSDLVIIGREPTTGSVEYNTPMVYDSASEVSNDFGADSDVHVASEQAQSRGVEQWWVVMLDTTSNSETLSDSDTTATDTGTVSNAPIRGGLSNITVELDGTDQTVVPTTSAPPDKPDPGEAAVNFDTGEVVTGDTSSGSGTGIVVDYETATFSTGLKELEPLGMDLMVLADTRADLSYIGEADTLAAWGDQYEASLFLAYENGSNYDTEEDAMAAAHEFGGYISSGRVFPIAHKSPDDVAAGVAGRAATKRAWFNPYMDGGADYSFSMDEYSDSLIGTPSNPGTFEGGDADQAGPANVLHTEQGVQILSNSLSTAGAASDFQYFDVARTQSFIGHEARDALKTLMLTTESIPFAPAGRAMIQSTLRKRLNKYVAAQGRVLSQEEIRRLQQQLEREDSEESDEFEIPERRSTDSEADVPLSELEINVPAYDDLDVADRANRRWTGIQVIARLAGHTHTFSVDLSVKV